MRLFVYEHISAGGLGPDAPGSLRREGWAMLAGVVEDFERVPSVETVTLLDGSAPSLGRECRRASADDGSHNDPFRKLARAADATLIVAPEFDGLLRLRSQWVLAEGGRLLGSHPEAIALTG